MPLPSFYDSLTAAGRVEPADASGLKFLMRAPSDNLFDINAGVTPYNEVLTSPDALNRVAEARKHQQPRRQPGRLRSAEILKEGCLAFVEGIRLENGAAQCAEARTAYLMHSLPGKYRFEETRWRLVQISQMAERWLGPSGSTISPTCPRAATSSPTRTTTKASACTSGCRRAAPGRASKSCRAFSRLGGRTRGIRVDGVDRSENLIPTNAKDFQIQSRASAKPAELVVEFMKFPG